MKRILIGFIAALPTLGVSQDAAVPDPIREQIEQMDRDLAQDSGDTRRNSIPLMSLSMMFEDETVRQLARAAGRGDIQTVDRLVNEGVDVNARGLRGATPLYWALRNRNGFQRLLELGANPNVVYDDNDRTSIMRSVIDQQDTDFLRLALEHGGDPNLRAGTSNEPPIFRAVSEGDMDKIRILIEASADLNARGGVAGWTPMMSGTALSRYEAIYLLLEHGADYTLRNDYGRDLVALIILNMPRVNLNSGSKAQKWMIKVSDWLKERGVEIPDE